MLTGKRFRLKKESLAIEGRKAITIPEGQVIQVLSGPRPNDMRMLDVTWDGRTFVMFAIDIQERGEEV